MKSFSKKSNGFYDCGNLLSINKKLFYFRLNFTENYLLLPVCIKLFATFAKVFSLIKNICRFLIQTLQFYDCYKNHAP